MHDAHAHPDRKSDAAALPLGAHLVTRRFGYTHHGIYVGAGQVVHYAGLAGVVARRPVEEVALASFAAGRDVCVKPEPGARFAAEAVAQRARSRLGENRYRLVTNNCEHFCAWCLHGEGRSEQAELVIALPRVLATLLVRVRSAFRRAPEVAQCADDEVATGAI